MKHFVSPPKAGLLSLKKKHIYNSNIFYYLQENPLGQLEQSDLNCMMKSTMNEIRKYEESVESYRGVLKTRR